MGLMFGLSMFVVCFRVAENELFDYSDLNVSMANGYFLVTDLRKNTFGVGP